MPWPTTLIPVLAGGCAGIVWAEPRGAAARRTAIRADRVSATDIRTNTMWLLQMRWRRGVQAVSNEKGEENAEGAQDAHEYGGDPQWRRGISGLRPRCSARERRCGLGNLRGRGHLGRQWPNCRRRGDLIRLGAGRRR